MKNNKRKFRRYFLNLEASWKGTFTHHNVNSRITNLGLGGCFLECKEYPAIGDNIQITIVYNNGQLLLPGEVKYLMPERGIGIKFGFLKKEQILQLIWLVNYVRDELSTKMPTKDEHRLFE
jgi:hypothetical protein